MPDSISSRIFRTFFLGGILTPGVSRSIFGPCSNRFRTVSTIFGRFRPFSDHVRTVLGRFPTVSDSFGQFRTVFGRFWTVSNRFRTVLDSFGSFSNRFGPFSNVFRLFSDDSVLNLKFQISIGQGWGPPSRPVRRAVPAPALAN